MVEDLLIPRRTFAGDPLGERAAPLAELGLLALERPRAAQREVAHQPCHRHVSVAESRHPLNRGVKLRIAGNGDAGVIGGH